MLAATVTLYGINHKLAFWMINTVDQSLRVALGYFAGSGGWASTEMMGQDNSATWVPFGDDKPKSADSLDRWFSAPNYDFWIPKQMRLDVGGFLDGNESQLVN